MGSWDITGVSGFCIANVLWQTKAHSKLQGKKQGKLIAMDSILSIAYSLI